MSKFSKSFKIAIADIILHIKSEKTIELEDGYVPFLVENTANEDIIVTCHQYLPEVDYTSYSLVFEAKNEQQRFYSIYATPDALCFVIFDQNTINTVQQIAYLNSDNDSWTVFSANSMSLKYPMGAIIMHYFCLHTDVVMMHASCVFDGKKGRIFSGFSGAGKSTMSMLWAKSGALIVNDDRLIIRKINDEFWVYNTPMYYVDVPKKVKLDEVFLISHATQNVSKRINGALAVSKVMAFCIQNNFDGQSIQKRLDFFDHLCSKVNVYELGFVPNDSVVNYIVQNGQ